MCNSGRGNEHGEPWRELHNELQLPEYNVPTERVVVVTKRGDPAPAKGNVLAVTVPRRDRLGAKIKRSGGPYTTFEVTAQLLVVLNELGEVFVEVCMQFGSPRREGRGGKPSDPNEGLRLQELF